MIKCCEVELSFVKVSHLNIIKYVLYTTITGRFILNIQGTHTIMHIQHHVHYALVRCVHAHSLAYSWAIIHVHEWNTLVLRRMIQSDFKPDPNSTRLYYEGGA